MYRFAMDGNEANVTQRVGSNVYAFEVLTALEQLTRTDQEYNWTVLLAGPPVSDLPTARPGWRYQVVGPRPFWTQWGLPWHLFRHRHAYDAFFTPGHYAPRLCPIPYISAVMDLAFLKYPQQFRRKDYLQLKEWTRYSVQHARKVLAISEFTRQAVIKTYHKPTSDVFVAYPALPQPSPGPKVSPQWLKKTVGVSSGYILYVGTLQPRKNLLTLLKAYELFVADYPARKEPPPLVIAGKIGWLADEFLAAVQRSVVQDRVKLLGYVSEAEKAVLYRKSACAVLLGLYEGFGIPPLEAMAHNTIPVVAETSSLPEVVGAAGYRVPAQQPKAIAQALRQVLKLTATQRARQLKLGRQQAKQFDWLTSARQIQAALVEVVTDASPKTATDSGS